MAIINLPLLLLSLVFFPPSPFSFVTLLLRSSFLAWCSRHLNLLGLRMMLMLLQSSILSSSVIMYCSTKRVYLFILKNTQSLEIAFCSFLPQQYFFLNLFLQKIRHLGEKVKLITCSFFYLFNFPKWICKLKREVDCISIDQVKCTFYHCTDAITVCISFLLLSFICECIFQEKKFLLLLLHFLALNGGLCRCRMASGLRSLLGIHT